MDIQTNTKVKIKFSRPIELKLGQRYVVWTFGRPRECQLIQPTEKGYNFLELSTSKCILKHHLYPYKKITHGTFFFLYQDMRVWEIPDMSAKTA